MKSQPRKTTHKQFSQKVLSIILFGGLVVLLVGWYGYAHRYDAATSSTQTGLTIMRTNSLSQPGVTNFTKAVSNDWAVTLLSDIKAMKPLPNDGSVYNCPNDDGVDYTFAFTRPKLRATAPAGGCSWVTYDGASYFSDDAFWKDVSSATGEPIDPLAE